VNGREAAIGAGAGALLALLVVVTVGEGTPRALVVVGFLLLCPGTALAHAIGVRGGWELLAAGVTLSVAVDLLVGLAFLYAGQWSPDAVFAVLVALSFAGVAAEAVRDRAAAP
jgi:uncharacterized membrane protein